MQEKTFLTIKKVINDNQLFILPLHSINITGKCSCGKEDCHSPGKHPLFRYNWKIIASNKPEKIDEWFSAYKNMNFGLATGRLSKLTNKYLIVIDVDAAEHPILKTLPNTFSYRTGSGGWHFWFWSKYPIKNSVSLIADKVDIRGTDGYVVIPPSKHYKGTYNNINDASIADLPNEILSIVFSDKPKQIDKKNKEEKKSKKPPNKPISSIWVTESIPNIRLMIQQKEMVPEGVRNVVLHRLLSSDRAKGAQREELEKNASKYLNNFVKGFELFGELDTIIDSVEKYPAYNNSYEKVNENYINWLEKEKNIRIGPVNSQKLIEADNNFFSLLKPTDIREHKVTLEYIIHKRLSWLEKQGLQYISNYKTQAMAKKLIGLGFKRHRTSKGNWWNVMLPDDHGQQENKKHFIYSAEQCMLET